MNTPKLSICIATLNRAKFIGTTLECICAQLTEKVEVVIVDGASTDNTQEIVQHYQLQVSQLHYYRLAAKGGVDQDYAKAVQFARGEYCWLMTDDDLLKPGAVTRVLDACHKNYCLIIVNAQVWNADMSRLFEPRRLAIEKDTVYPPSENARFFTDTAKYLTFIGGVVIQRELWNQREKEAYYGSEFAHVGVIFQDALPADTLVIAEPLIMIRYGNALWTWRSFRVWLFQWPDLIWALPRFSPSQKEAVCAHEPWKRLRTLLVERAKGTFTLDEYRGCIEPHLRSIWRKRAIWLVAVAPGPLLNVLALFYFSLFRREELVEPSDFRSSRFYYRRYLARIMEKLI